MIHVLRSIFFSIFLIGTSGLASNESNEISYTEAGPIVILRSHDQKVSNLLANEGDTLQTAIRDSLKRKINSVRTFIKSKDFTKNVKDIKYKACYVISVRLSAHQ